MEINTVDLFIFMETYCRGLRKNVHFRGYVNWRIPI